jgi:hypothetical protein
VRRERAAKMAARGCVSGTLAEWPILRAAFEAGSPRRPEMPTDRMIAQARQVVGYVAFRRLSIGSRLESGVPGRSG